MPHTKKSLNAAAPKTFCYWSIGDKKYAFFLKTLVKTARKCGVTEDIHVWSDRKIDGAFTHDIDRKDIGNLRKTEKYLYEYKLRYLKKMLVLKYDYYVFLDADNYFVRKPRDPLTLLKADPLHIFLETNLEEAHRLTKSVWFNYPIASFTKEMRKMGVKKKEIYNVNGGFFIVSRDHVLELCGLVDHFYRYMCTRGCSSFSDEFGLCYALHMLCKDPKDHLLKDNLDFYGLYTIGESTKKLPDGKPWTMEMFFTGEKIKVNPAIVHCYLNKNSLLKYSSSLLERILV